MIRKIRKFILFSFLFCCRFTDLLSQTSQGQTYVVVIFEEKYKITMHGKKEYFWIIASDSLKDNESKLSRLFLSNFSKANLEDCCKGNPIDPYIVTDTSHFILDQAFDKEIETLKMLISKNKSKIQRISKKWESGQKQTITIYAIPIRGHFCFSEFHQIGKERISYNGKVSIPFSSFIFAEGFWETPNAKFILNRDFSNQTFDIFPFELY